jgi:hypothetical protein
MDRYITQFVLSLGRVDQHVVRFLVFLLIVILFVLGAGAPGAGGDIGIH